MLDDIFEKVDDFMEYNITNNICEECDKENCICNDNNFDDIDDSESDDEDNEES